MKGKMKHIIAAMCSIVLTVITVLSPLAGQEVFAASWVMSDTTINEGRTVNYDDAYIYNLDTSASPQLVFTNNGTVNVNSGGFTLSDFKFINNGKFTFNSPNEFFTLGGSCSEFINYGTADINYNSWSTNSGCSFTNEGTLYLRGGKNINLTGFTNNGVIYYDSTVSDGCAERIKTIPGTGVVKQLGGTTDYTISYNLNGGVNSSKNRYTFSYSDSEGAVDMTIIAASKAGYKFLGWTGSNGDIPQTEYIFSTAVQKNLSFTANWELIDYPITYNLDGGSFSEDNSPVAVYNYEESVTIDSQPVKEGYTFSGWTGSNGDIPQKTITIDKNSTGEKVYNANWSANDDTAYKVIRYYQNIDGTYSSEETIFNGVTDKEVSVNPDDYAKEGFTFDDGASNVSGTVAADNSLELKLYYTRDRYTVYFLSNDGNTVLDSNQFYYGEQLSYTKQTPTMNVEDYDCEFAGWAKSAESSTAEWEDEAPLATENTAYFAVFNLIPKFVILNWLEHTGFEEPQETTIKLTKGTPYVVDLNLVSEKYCIGTEEWHTPALAAAHIYYEDEKGTHALKLGTDYTVTTEGFGKPVRLSINGSAMMHDLKIILDAFYHEEHDFDSESYSTVVTEGSCTVDKVVEHMCYKCGKTELETIPAPGHSYGDDYLQEVKDGKEVHYKKCEVCATPTEAEECSGGSATFEKKAVCATCGREYGELKADNEFPTGTIKVNTNEWKELLNKITFGIFFKDTQKVSISAEDNWGVESISYCVTADAIDVTDASVVWTEYSDTFDIAENKSVVYAKIVDKAGNITYISTDGMIIDGKAPVITGAEADKTYCGKIYVQVSDDNLDKVEINGKEVTPDASGYAVLPQKTQDVVQTITATDKSGNKATLNITVNDGHKYADYTQETKDGKEVHYRECQVCGEKTEAEECSGGNATCVKKAVCEVCGHEYGSLSEHQYEMKITKEPTITENGERVYTCKTCGDSYTEVIDKLKITLGDANGDGVVDLNDTMIVLEAALGINDIEEDNFIKADVNSNGTIDLVDAVLVLKAALRIIEL